MKCAILALVSWRGFFIWRSLMLLPIGLKVEGKLCLLVGGGTIAAHKCQTLLAHGARVRVVAPAFNDDPAWLHDNVERIHSAYEAKYLVDVSLVVAATSDPLVNKLIVEDCRSAGLFVLSVDSPQDCDWNMPATLRRGDFTVSFGTDGVLPALAARVKRDAASIFGEDLARLCEDARRLRQLAHENDRQQRNTSLRGLADSLDEFWYLSGVRDLCANHSGAGDSTGKVYLVGAGPGDPGLITMKGAECLRAATVVIHDALANGELLDMYCGGALRIDVSKRKGKCLHMQPEINQMLIDWARRGHTVVRLKGGDPMIFGRGGEEARALAGAGVAFEIVPGVSSLSSVPAYAGIPVTDREYCAASVGIYSLHRKSGGGLTEEEWRRMAQGPETLVLFMGMTLLATAVAKLRLYGRKANTPIALITQGTLPDQREVTATLETILECGELKELLAPGLIVVGNVVEATSRMGWFHPREPARNEPQHPTAADGIEHPLEIVLVRHAEVEEPYQGRYIGSTEAALSERGTRQAAALTANAELQEPGTIYASPMLRVRQTVAAARPNDSCVWLDDLSEIRFGDWEKCTNFEVLEKDPLNADYWKKLDGSFAFPGGDSLESFQRRISRAAGAIVAQARADKDHRKTFIFAHAVVIRFLIAHWLGLPLRSVFSMAVSYASVSTIRLQDDRGVLTKLNGTEHLRNV
jgi:uroporphyrin-III C-methyltransferase/precorrin-2 dehydrogenase/sirohydrochlorin ferrochelatase